MLCMCIPVTSKQKNWWSFSTDKEVSFLNSHITVQGTDVYLYTGNGNTKENSGSAYDTVPCVSQL